MKRDSSGKSKAKKAKGGKIGKAKGKKKGVAKPEPVVAKNLSFPGTTSDHPLIFKDAKARLYFSPNKWRILPEGERVDKSISFTSFGNTPQKNWEQIAVPYLKSLAKAAKEKK